MIKKSHGDSDSFPRQKMSAHSTGNLNGLTKYLKYKRLKFVASLSTGTNPTPSKNAAQPPASWNLKRRASNSISIPNLKAPILVKTISLHCEMNSKNWTSKLLLAQLILSSLKKTYLNDSSNELKIEISQIQGLNLRIYILYWLGWGANEVS